MSNFHQVEIRQPLSKEWICKWWPQTTCLSSCFPDDLWLVFHFANAFTTRGGIRWYLQPTEVVQVVQHQDTWRGPQEDNNPTAGPLSGSLCKENRRSSTKHYKTTFKRPLMCRFRPHLGHALTAQHCSPTDLCKKTSWLAVLPLALCALHRWAQVLTVHVTDMRRWRTFCCLQHDRFGGG